MIHPVSFVTFLSASFMASECFFFFVLFPNVGISLALGRAFSFLAQHTRCYCGLHPLGTLILLLFDY